MNTENYSDAFSLLPVNLLVDNPLFKFVYCLTYAQNFI